MNLQTNVLDAGRNFRMYASKLQKLELFTLGDFLYHVPNRYENFTIISPIGEIQAGEIVTVKGQVVDFKSQYTRSRITIQKATLTDETGSVELVWFNQPYLSRVINVNDTLSVAGAVEGPVFKPVIKPTEYEVVAEGVPLLHTGRLVPVYPQTTGVTSKWLRRQIYWILTSVKGTIEDYLPESIKQQFKLLDLEDAIWKIHFPDSLEEAAKARERLAFDELFLMQTKALERKKAWETQTIGHAFEIKKHQTQIDKLIKSLPFELTNAQKQAVEAIFADVSETQPMNRLLQGDVGSGKTVVAGIAMYLAHLNGFQSVLMAPTEILAQQHYKTISSFLEPFGVKVDLVTSSQKLSAKGVERRENKKRTTKHSALRAKPYAFDILIGTHAVLAEKVQFNNLGLVVIDEQQRFGVEQRGIIRSKGDNPHLLTMTATPIPRTVALTMYGDLNLSYLSDMPKGRKHIKTWLVPMEKREAAYDWIRKQVTNATLTRNISSTHSGIYDLSGSGLPEESKGITNQAFIICPFIEESESMVTVKAATKEFETLSKKVYPDLKLGLLHGKQKAKEKDEILKNFKDKKFHILVATPVVEVGIDIPNATVMMIEAADRFGLAQLHQLRGRVGRGDKQSYCLLFTENTSQRTTERLKAMETSHSGAELAELDLRLRGPGDIYGTSQHGMPRLKVATFSDFELIEKAKQAAEDTFEKIGEYPKLEERLKQVKIENVNPD